MNWPALSPETSQALADVLRDVAQAKPADLFEDLSRRLQERSGLEAASFAAHFEECRRKPKPFVLEDKCPAGQDAYAWVAMRYNDETILSVLQGRATELAADLLSTEPEETASYLQRAGAAYPEMNYLQDSPEELLAFQALRAACLCCSGCADVRSQLEDADARLSFRCRSLVEVVRGHVTENLREPGLVDLLLACSLLRILGASGDFRARLGGGKTSPEMAVLHAIEQSPKALPSFQRLPERQKKLVVGCLRAAFPWDALASLEASQGHFLEAKEAFEGLSSPPEAFALLAAVMAVDHVARSRSLAVTQERADLGRLGAQCLQALDKYSAPRAYEMLLRKRAERHKWALAKDDLLLRATVRLASLTGSEKPMAWAALRSIVEGLKEEEKSTLKRELVRKDGVSEAPVFAPAGAAALMALADSQGPKALLSAVRVLVRALAEAAKALDASGERTVLLDLGDLVASAREHGSVPALDGLALSLQVTGPGRAAVRVSGAGG